MEYFERFFEEGDKPEVANEFFAEIHEKYMNWAVPNFKKGLQKLRDRAKEANSVSEIKDVLADAKKVSTQLTAIIEDSSSKNKDVVLSKESIAARFKAMWPLFIPIANIPLFITNYASDLKELSKEAKDEKEKLGMRRELDYLQKKLFMLAKDNYKDAQRLVTLLEVKLKAAEKKEKK